MPVADQLTHERTQAVERGQRLLVSLPSTTSRSSKPASILAGPCAARAAPAKRQQELCVPMRVDAPAASTTAVIIKGDYFSYSDASEICHGEWHAVDYGAFRSNHLCDADVAIPHARRSEARQEVAM